MSGPVLVAVDEDAGALRDVERELRDRYARHYRVVCMRSPREVLARLEELAAEGEQVALVLAGQRLSGTTGGELLDQARHLHPHAKRGLLMAWDSVGDRATGEAIFDSIARGWIDHYVLRPSESSDEVFHQAISSLLLEWAEARRASPHTIHVVGDSWSGRAYELRHLLGRCAFPHSFCLADSSDGRTLVAQAGEGAKLPIVAFPDGTLLSDPSNADLASAAGSPVNPERMRFDLVIVGAGPAGLSAAVYGASEGFSTLVVDEGGLGGQATSSPLIRNYLGFPRGVSGRRLALQAYVNKFTALAPLTVRRPASARRSPETSTAASASVSHAGPAGSPTSCASSSAAPLAPGGAHPAARDQATALHARRRALRSVAGRRGGPRLRRAALLAGATASDDGEAGLLVLTTDETVELANTAAPIAGGAGPPAADREPTFRPLSAPSAAGPGAASTMTWTASPPGTSPCPGLPQRSRRAECRTRGGGEFGRRRGRALLACGCGSLLPVLDRLDCRCLAGSLCGGRNRQGLSARPVPPCFSPPMPWPDRRSLDMVLDSICRIRSRVTP